MIWLDLEEGYFLLKRITDIDGQTPLSMEERFQDHFFFPRVDSSSNYPSALQQAPNFEVSGML